MTGPSGWPHELLPYALAQGHLGELALGAQPGLDLGEREGGAGLGTADGFGEVGVAAPPVADGGPADSGEPGDPRRGDLCPVLLHPSAPLVLVCGVEHTDACGNDSFTAVYSPFYVNHVDSVHRLCCD